MSILSDKETVLHVHPIDSKTGIVDTSVQKRVSLGSPIGHETTRLVANHELGVHHGPLQAKQFSEVNRDAEKEVANLQKVKQLHGLGELDGKGYIITDKAQGRYITDTEAYHKAATSTDPVAVNKVLTSAVSLAGDAQMRHAVQHGVINASVPCSKMAFTPSHFTLQQYASLKFSVRGTRRQTDPGESHQLATRESSANTKGASQGIYPAARR